MYSYEFRKSLERDLLKLAKKKPKLLLSIENKIQEIISCEDINHYKNLRSPLQNLKRVHIEKSFVLVFSIDEKNKKIIFEDFDHHDNIYR
jgi:YafQ family addiction module toxin component